MADSGAHNVLLTTAINLKIRVKNSVKLELQKQLFSHIKSTSIYVQCNVCDANTRFCRNNFVTLLFYVTLNFLMMTLISIL